MALAYLQTVCCGLADWSLCEWNMLSPALKGAIDERKADFQSYVLTWALSNSRDYPWRRLGKDPYEVMVAELLLKRTTAASAVRGYECFIAKYPTLVHLATASEEELVQDLAPVGLQQQRARAIAQLAQYLIANEHGTLPNCLERLLRVPGLGNYSARAILSFGFGVCVAAVDANVERVVHRVFWQGMPARPSHSLLQRVADAILPEETHRGFNFGLLDLGALVCRYVAPRCTECPLNTVCDFYRLDVATGAQVATATKLREMRLAKGVGLVQLAKKAGMSKLTIINIEAGRTIPRPETLQRLAAALGVPTEELTPRR